MSHISWIMAANHTHGLSQPFLSRVRVIHVRDPAPEELHAFCLHEGRRRGLAEASFEAAAEAIRWQASHKQANLRDAIKRLDLAELLERMQGQPFRQ